MAEFVYACPECENDDELKTICDNCSGTGTIIEMWVDYL